MTSLRGFALVLPVFSLLAACGTEPGVTSVDTFTDTPADPVVTNPPVGTPPEAPEVLPAVALNAVLTGREVVPAVYDTRATGAATFTLDGERTQLSYTLEHTVESPTAAHLHLGLAGDSGEEMLTLPLTPGVLTGTVEVTRAQARALEDGTAYIDIHSEAHPNGEVRAQVVRPGELVYVARLSGDQVNPPTSVTSSGLGQLLVDGTTNRVRFNMFTRGMTVSPIAVDIRVAPAGADGPVAVDLTDPKTPPAPLLAGARTITSTQDLDAGRWYIHVGSARFPTGEMRGQILRPGEELYVARMSGDEAVPPVNSTGYGSLSIIVGVDRDRVRYDGLVTDVRPTAVTLRDSDGEVLLQLRTSDRAFNGLSMLEQGSRLLPRLPENAVHVSAASTGFPGGEVGGLVRRVGF